MWTEYRILICKLCKFGKYICYNFRDIEFVLGVTFLARPVYSTITGRVNNVKFQM